MANLGALTLIENGHSYPAYVSVNINDAAGNGAPDRVSITVRGAARPLDPALIPAKVSAAERPGWITSGSEATISMSLKQFGELLEQISAGFKARGI